MGPTSKIKGNEKVDKEEEVLAIGNWVGKAKWSSLINIK